MKENVKNKLTDIFGMDLRSLALFRIWFSFVMMLDIGERMTNITVHYTDLGVLPRYAVYDYLLPHGQMWLSPYFFSGSAWWVALLMSIHMVLLVLLLFGYRTRLLTGVCWLFLISIQDRNSLVGHGGDVLERIILMWAFFLPWGAKWSIDSIVNSSYEAVPKRILTPPTICFILQIAFVYWFAIAYKWNASWLNGSAVYYALTVDQFATNFGRWMLNYKEYLVYLTWFVMLFEGLGPILIFSPWATGPIKTLVVFGFIFLHLLFGFALKINFFDYVSIASWIPILPTWFWDSFLPKFHFFKLSSLSAISTRFSQLIRNKFSPRPLILYYSKFEYFIAVTILSYIFIYNLRPMNNYLDKKLPKTFSAIGNYFRIAQQWAMFSEPLTEDGWYVIPGQLLSGREVDLFRDGAPVSWDKPKSVSGTYKDGRWIKYMINLSTKKFVNYRLFYAQYLCRQWNSTHEGLQRVKTFQIYYMLELTLPDRESEPKKVILWKHDCFAPTQTKFPEE